MSSAVTWYDVLGVLPDASQQDIRAAWQARREALAPDLLAGATPAVLAAAGRAGLDVAPVQLTAHPMPVEGLVVAQAPAAGQRVHRNSTLTVQLWHPPEPGN